MVSGDSVTGRKAVRDDGRGDTAPSCGDGAIALCSVPVVEQAERTNADTTATDAAKVERKVGKQAPRKIVDIDSRIGPFP
jgi:hypothetical protein